MMFSVASFVSYVFRESSWHRYDHLVLSQTTHNFWRMSRKAGTAFFTIIGQKTVFNCTGCFYILFTEAAFPISYW